MNLVPPIALIWLGISMLAVLVLWAHHTRRKRYQILELTPYEEACMKLELDMAYRVANLKKPKRDAQGRFCA